MSDITPLRWEDGALWLLDQRLLPAEETWIPCRTVEDVAVAIETMVVRGAPAIGCAAAFGMALAKDAERAAAAARLRRTRPTAVNLAWGIDRMLAAKGDPVAEALAIWKDDIDRCRRIGKAGAPLIPDQATVLTHCNAGALATGGYGTALGVIRAAREAGKRLKVLADETRPWLQGARLTAWELQRDGFDVSLVPDGAAAWLMKKGEVTCVVVGADRIAANGDAANKIGTYGLAIAAREHGIPFYVAAPLSTVDLATPDGSAIPIEERSQTEVTELRGTRIAPAGVGARNPAFDVTPARLITAIILETGVIERPAEGFRDRLGPHVSS